MLMIDIGTPTARSARRSAQHSTIDASRRGKSAEAAPALVSREEHRGVHRTSCTARGRWSNIAGRT